MFRKELCVPSAFVPSVYSVSKMSSCKLNDLPSIRCRNFKHRVHRHLLSGDYTEYLKVQKNSQKEASPYPLVGLFELYLSLCKTDSYKGICGTCYSSTPKNDCFLNKVAYLCKQKRKSLTNSPTRPPREGRSADREIAPKVSEVSARMLRDKRS